VVEVLHQVAVMVVLLVQAAVGQVLLTQQLQVVQELLIQAAVVEVLVTMLILVLQLVEQADQELL
jgi:hypothetical protein